MAELRVPWVSPRRWQPADDAVASQLVQIYLLHDLLARAKMPVGEFSPSHHIVLEVPPNAVTGFEHRLISLVCKIRNL